jgi:hypothetical protein
VHGRLVRAVEAGHVGLDPTFELTPIVGAPPWIDEALATVGGNIAAYRAMGTPLASVDAALQWRARQLAKMLSLVGSSNVAPRAMVDAACKAVEHSLVDSATGVQAWPLVLEGILACPVGALDTRASARARAVRASLGASVPAASLPPSMRNPSAAMLIAAERAITEETRLLDDASVSSRPLRITHGKAGAGAVSPWGAAGSFCSGVRRGAAIKSTRPRQR